MIELLGLSWLRGFRIVGVKFTLSVNITVNDGKVEAVLRMRRASSIRRRQVWFDYNFFPAFKKVDLDTR